MITLITGSPGSGKTCYSMQFLLDAEKEGRVIYSHGIPDLKIKHIPVFCDSPSCDVCPPPPVIPVMPDQYCGDNPILIKLTEKLFADHDEQMIIYKNILDIYNNRLLGSEWQNWAPDGCYIFYDEVQNIFRPRSSGGKIPDGVKSLEIHRHKGIDFLFLTQGPRLLDINCRSLCSKHIHLVSSWHGRTQFEWAEVSENVKSVTLAAKSRYKLNTKNFNLYKSASLHTKVDRKIPGVVYVLGVSIIAISVLVFTSVDRMYARTHPDYVAINSDNVSVPVSSNPQLKSFVIADASINRLDAANWSSSGIDPVGVAKLPLDCNVGGGGISCPPGSLDPSLVASSSNKICNEYGGCTVYYTFKKNNSSSRAHRAATTEQRGELVTSND